MNGRHMISYDLPPGRFNFRAAAIAIRDGHVLIHRATFQDFWALPGGRVEWGESCEQAVTREIEEELGVRGEVDRLLFVRESFFTDQGKRFHELGYYFRVSLPDSFPFRTYGEICHRCRDGGAELEFKWVPIAGEALAEHAFVPEALRQRFSRLGDDIEHLVFFESEAGVVR